MSKSINRQNSAEPFLDARLPERHLEQAHGKRRLVCRLCITEGVTNSQVIEGATKRPSHRKHFVRIVCVTCWQRGRETPATCRTFVSTTPVRSKMVKAERHCR